ncbi:MAG: efflux RND transporter periplasmic adaptor subunit [Richelia sp. RM2_1_2]|nr:efflux RND transporter periplasmic adaptor subunit [Richelia sp. SM2_1_7]NJM20272.1 efflux RND transporter periplasmic adaptor subunit [Richelia sp. SM1_7_0]NJN11750.1 efflux RND transporter periplasmic adaptor subunit [Richelia sp. RM1_1_1]NJO30252.1 efflux RND transporter periplasmic adaptor subunit [Richelia sp. SL_2_1]NJO58322.1 efflux RND transporter periplasmic adaptor subunit [Richelia sp. RM2_1_2]
MNQQSIPEILENEKSSPSHRWQLVLAGSIILLAGVGIGKLKFEQNETRVLAQTQIRPLSVETIKIQLAKNYQTVQSYTGEVVAMRTSEIGFERSGKLVEVLVDEGDRVKKGAILAFLDTANLQAQRQSLIAQKAQAEARLVELKNGARIEVIAAAKARVRDVEKQLKLEQIKRDRRKYLYEQGAISKEQFDEVAFNSQALLERLNNAQSNLEELLNGTRYEQKAGQQAAVDQLSAQIKDLDITIAKSTLKAPFTGTIGLRSVDEGTVVEAGRSIVRLVQDNQPEVKIGVPIDVAKKLGSQSQQELEIGGKTYSARVKSILPEVDPATRTRTVILQLASTAQVSPKEIARFKISQTQEIEGYWLPITALVKGDRGLWSCYAVVDQKDGNSKVERRLVEVLETNGKQVLVRGTIQAGDTIVTEGTQRLVPGQLVISQSI